MGSIQDYLYDWHERWRSNAIPGRRLGYKRVDLSLARFPHVKQDSQQY